MKKNLLAIMAVVLGIGFSAFTTEKAPVVDQGAKLTSFYWFTPAGQYVGRQDTKANEIPASLCPNTGTKHCEDGFLDQDLNVSGDPDSGLKSGAVIRETIVKP